MAISIRELLAQVLNIKRADDKFGNFEQQFNQNDKAIKTGQAVESFSETGVYKILDEMLNGMFNSTTNLLLKRNFIYSEGGSFEASPLNTDFINITLEGETVLNAPSIEERIEILVSTLIHDIVNQLCREKGISFYDYLPNDINIKYRDDFIDVKEVASIVSSTFDVNNLLPSVASIVDYKNKLITTVKAKILNYLLLGSYMDNKEI